MDHNLRFAAKKALKRETNQFLIEIKRLMEEDGVADILKNGNKPGRTQFNSLMDAAGEASCIEELMLFLSYQVSKKEGWEKKCANNESIAKNVVNSFLNIQDTIYPCIQKEYGVNVISYDDERVLRLEIAEKYMGYLYWRATIESRDGEGKNVS